MSLIVRALQIYVPQPLKRLGLKELFSLSAGAFKSVAPDISGLSFDQSLVEYAMFTRDESLKAIRNQNVPAVRDRLYENARRMGRELRKSLLVTTPEQAASAFALLYRLIGIESAGSFPGEVVVSQCFFSRYYSGEVCRIMSALDSGIAAGLSGGGSLTFSQRITEGSDCCRAEFIVREDLP